MKAWTREAERALWLVAERQRDPSAAPEQTAGQASAPGTDNAVYGALAETVAEQAEQLLTSVKRFAAEVDASSGIADVTEALVSVKEQLVEAGKALDAVAGVLDADRSDAAAQPAHYGDAGDDALTMRTDGRPSAPAHRTDRRPADDKGTKTDDSEPEPAERGRVAPQVVNSDAVRRVQQIKAVHEAAAVREELLLLRRQVRLGFTLAFLLIIGLAALMLWRQGSPVDAATGVGNSGDAHKIASSDTAIGSDGTAAEWNASRATDSPDMQVAESSDDLASGAESRAESESVSGQAATDKSVSTMAATAKVSDQAEVGAAAAPATEANAEIAQASGNSAGDRLARSPAAFRGAAVASPPFRSADQPAGLESKAAVEGTAAAWGLALDPSLLLASPDDLVTPEPEEPIADWIAKLEDRLEQIEKGEAVAAASADGIDAAPAAAAWQAGASENSTTTEGDAIGGRTGDNTGGKTGSLSGDEAIRKVGAADTVAAPAASTGPVSGAEGETATEAESPTSGTASASASGAAAETDATVTQDAASASKTVTTQADATDAVPRPIQQPEPPPPAIETVVGGTETAPELPGLKRVRLEQSGFAVQLGSFKTSGDALTFLRRCGLEPDRLYVRALANYHTVLLGVYQDRTAANTALSALSDKLQSNKPWVIGVEPTARLYQASR
ncbi:SPOR domain-containing protein [Thiohalocapsa marina]|uniref:SPOR domain-containing protein n=1 Tax=Thiohalocapsa marina TaxID=424902 RepID=UPI001478DBA1|nr:SPOR domain-containing protein [Thiohalocapsa marina]